MVSVLGTLVLVLVGWGVVVLGRKGWRAVGFGGRKGREWDWDWDLGLGFDGRGRGRGRIGRRWLDRRAGRRVVVVVEEGTGRGAEERRPLLV